MQNEDAKRGGGKYLLKIAGIIGILLVALATKLVHKTINESNLSAKHKEDIYGALSLYVITSMSALSYIVFIL